MSHVSPNLTGTPATGWKKPGPWALALLLGGFLSLLGYGVFPALGLSGEEGPPLVPVFLILLGCGVGGFLYRTYWGALIAQPFRLLYFILIGWPLVNYANTQLIRTVGLNIHLRPLLFLFLGIPAVWFFFTQGGKLLVRFPFLKYLLAFMAVVFLYFLLNNGMATDLGWMVEDFWSERSIPSLELTSYLFCVMSVFLTAVGVFRLNDPQGAFDQLNRWFIGFSTFLSGIIIVGYPLNFLTMVVDGFKRTEGLLDHPNPYSHHMGIMLIYLVGLLAYYQGKENTKPFGRFLLMAIAVHLVAFLLGVSKTAIFTFALCMAFFALFTFSSKLGRQGLRQLGILGLVLLPMGLVVFRVISDQDFFQLLGSRVEDTKSLLWRTDVWNALLSDMTGGALLWGHGFTAASTRIFQLTYNNVENINPLILVHNGYLSLLYDFGLLGTLFFIAIASLGAQAFRYFKKSRFADARILMATVLTLCLYTVITCAFDEMTYMFDAAMLFWVFSTLLLALVMQEGKV